MFGITSDAVPAASLLNFDETQARGDAGYYGAESFLFPGKGGQWYNAIPRGRLRRLDTSEMYYVLPDTFEQLTVCIHG
jgi:hypothetical protein